MSRNKIITFIMISILGVSLFILFINILSEGDDEDFPSDRSVMQENQEDSSTTFIREKEDDDAAVSGLNDQLEESAQKIQISDGVYSAFVEYLAPRGFRDAVDVKLTIENGIIVNTNVQYKADNPDSEFYQSLFDQAYEEEVIGQSIEDLELSRVGGASLTTGAFMEAVDEIINEINATN